MAALTAVACRAGRALLGWGVRELAKKAGLSPTTVALLEGGGRHSDETAAKIVRAFAKAGVEILNGEGTGARLVRTTAKRRRKS